MLEIFWKNARSSYDTWGFTIWGWAVIGVIVFTLSLWLYFVIHASNQIKFDEQRKKINLLGYKDLDDIQIFLNRIDADLDDFILSKGIRKQYELFTEGKSSNFIKTAEANKKLKEAESNGYSTGLVTGIAVSSTINHR